MDERQFFTEKPEQRPARFQCPRCRRTNDYSIRWMRRTKKAQIPGGADERDRAIFGKSKDHLIRVDDDVTCKSCGKRFEIPSHRGLVFLEELEGLPQGGLRRVASPEPTSPKPCAQGPTPVSTARDEFPRDLLHIAVVGAARGVP